MTGQKFGLHRAERSKLIAGLSRTEPSMSPSRQWRLPGEEEMDIMTKGAEALGISDPYFRVHDGIAGAQTHIGGQPYINFSSYDYLGLNGRPEIAEGVAQAITRYGTTVSASRMVSGERPIHTKLEQALAQWHGAEDAVAMVSGHATNVTTVSQIMQKGESVKN